MLSVSNGDVVNLSHKVQKFYEKGAMAPIFYDKYLMKALSSEMKKVKLSEPVIIKIPKDIDSLLKRDFEPAREIRITEYPVIEGIPFWTGDSTYGVTIQIGYENGDSRFPCSVSFSDKDIHGILAGATGMGKSVALDSITYGIMTKYAPWEVCLTMADAKIVSFKSLADKGFPHIQSIAATEDVDYLISVLEYKHAEMKKMNSVLTTSGTGAANIMELREFTGLCFPRNIIVVDEFQAMFKGAGKKASKLTAILDDFARLGRNTGYHLLMASQELGSDINKNMLNQIKIRMALGCSASVSDQILGNDAARTLKQKGRLIMNLQPTEANNKEFNVEYRVPFLDPKRSKPLLNKAIADLGNTFGYKYNLNFYDEYNVVYEDRYPEYIREFAKDPMKLYLGEPCYYCDDPEKVYKVQFRGKPLENIIVLNTMESNQVRFVKMIKENCLMHSNMGHIVLYNDEDTYKAMGLSQLPGLKQEMRDTTAPYYKAAINDVYQRRMMCDVDSSVFVNQTYTEYSDRVYDSILKTAPKLQSSANRSRVFYMLQELENAEYQNIFGIKSLTGDKLTNAHINICYGILMKYAKYGFMDKQITKRTLPMQFNWIIGLNKMLGLGRDTKTSIQETLKKACQDASLYNVRFILVTSTSSDMSFLKECSRYGLLAATSDKDLRGLGLDSDDFPKSLSNVLGVIYDKENENGTFFKFKKMFLNGELLA